MEFKPKILGFLCNWCSYAGADLAGVSRNQYPANIRVIRVMCSGRVDPRYVVRALINGIDGVLVLGCHFGDCHYIDGNYEESEKFGTLKELLKIVNFDERVYLDWVSASEGLRFADIVTKFTDQIKKLGPSPIVNSSESSDPKNNIIDNLKAVEMVVSSSRMRSLVGRKRKITTQENVYGKKIDENEFQQLMKDAIVNEYLRNRIYIILKKKQSSVKDIAESMSLNKTTVFNNILSLRQRGLVDVAGIDGLNPIYKII